ncbi:MAG: hypothetical protein ACK4FA_02435 [Candidatus Paceibacteria bacterium]
MGAERPDLQEFLKTKPKDTTENVDVSLPTNKSESVQNKTETKKGKKEFDINVVSSKIQDAVEARRAEKQIALLESGREEDITEEEKNALDKELRQYALDLLLKEKKKYRKENIENSGPLVRYYHKFNKWYDSLEDTPRGRVGRKFLESGLTGSLFLGTATAAGLVPPTTALTQLGARVVTATTFRALAASAMNFLTKKRPDFVKKVANIFSEKNQSVTPTVEFKPENVAHTGVPNFSSENQSTTLEKSAPNIDFRKMKYAGIALGTSFVFLMGGWVAAAATGVALVSKEQLSDMLKRKIEKYKEQVNSLSSQINVDNTSELFLANIDQVSQELDKITKTIQELELVRSVVKGTMTYANGLVSADIGLPGGGSVRRLATDPADELKITSKKILKAEKKKNNEERLAA